MPLLVIYRKSWGLMISVHLDREKGKAVLNLYAEQMRFNGYKSALGMIVIYALTTNIAARVFFVIEELLLMYFLLLV